MRSPNRLRFRVQYVPLLVLAAATIGIALHYLSQIPGTSTTGRFVGGTVTRANPGLYSINHFIDGDTISVNMDGKAESVRLIGVDTPETHKPNTPVQCYGEAAAGYTKNLIGSNKVRLEADSESDNRDRYNRLLRYVYLPDGQLVDELLIQNGYGFAYTQFQFSKSAQFTADQDTAQAARKGLWAACRPYQEQGGRWQTNNAS